ncbi:MAG: hypothetical protein HC828_19465 [Blastochloris sp.]|nr:hypothetical protein [Blastochloris sp.]
MGLLVGALGDLAGIVTGIAGGGPVAWCGCLLGLGVCGLCGFFALAVASLFASCGTPNAVNFCALFGF